MDSKNYTQVLIDGKIYTLGGSEDEGYLQRAASYVNEKVNTLRRIPGFIDNLQQMNGKGYETVLLQKTSLWRNRISGSEACGG